jgi:hypothetical protein
VPGFGSAATSTWETLMSLTLPSVMHRDIHSAATSV